MRAASSPSVGRALHSGPLPLWGWILLLVLLPVLALGASSALFGVGLMVGWVAFIRWLEQKRRPSASS